MMLGWLVIGGPIVFALVIAWGCGLFGNKGFG
jgi:hypothetical protein